VLLVVCGRGCAQVHSFLPDSRGQASARWSEASCCFSYPVCVFGVHLLPGVPALESPYIHDGGVETVGKVVHRWPQFGKLDR
jgi:hypothetical protein